MALNKQSIGGFSAVMLLFTQKVMRMDSPLFPCFMESFGRCSISINCNTLQADSTDADYFNLNLHVH